MRFEKEILAALTTKFEGVSADILSKPAKKLAKSVTAEDQVQGAVDAVTLQQLIEGYGDARATDATQTAVRNYESKHKLKDGQPIKVDEPNEPAKPAPDDMPSWAQALAESNKALQEQLAKMQGERIAATRKQQLAEAISKLPESLRKPYERMAIDNLTDEDFNALIGEVSTEVEGIAGTLKAQGAKFSTPPTSGKTSPTAAASEKEMQAVMDTFTT